MRFLIRLLLNVLRLAFLPLTLLRRAVARRPSHLYVKIDAGIESFAKPVPWLQRFTARSETGFRSIYGLRQLSDIIIGDKNLRGVVVELPRIGGGWNTAYELRQWVRRISESQKAVTIYLPEGGGNKELYIAAAAKETWAHPGANFNLLGIGGTSRYFKPLLDKLGIEATVFRRSTYKSAGEAFTRPGPSEPQIEQNHAILSGIQKEFLSGLAAKSGVKAQSGASNGQVEQEQVEQVHKWLELGLVSGQVAIDCGLVNTFCFEDEITQKLEIRVPAMMSGGQYLARKKRPLFLPLVQKPYLGLVSVRGALRDGQSTDNLINELRAARRDPKIKGVLLYVNSPGGSAFASDQIHHEVLRLKKKKPVVALFGDVSASGGYYISAGANKIVTTPLTITGSIGVLMLRPVLETLMGKLGINTFVQKLDPLADLFSNPRPLSEHEKEIFEREIEVSYQRFLHIVSEGRSLPMDRTAEVAGGRVWLATQAKEEGLVDAIGGCGEAVDLLRAVAGASGRTELGLVDAPRRLLSGWRDWEQEKPKDKASRLIEQFAQYIDLAGDRPRALYLASDLPTDL